jgi:hypothetical protein
VTMTAPTTMSAVPSHAPRGARSVEEQHRQDQRDRSTEPVDGRDPQRITELERAVVSMPRTARLPKMATSPPSTADSAA